MVRLGNEDNGGMLNLVDEPDESTTQFFEDADDVMTVSTVSEFLHCNPQTVRREIARGRLGCFHVGRSVRVTRSQLLQYVNGVEAENGAATK